MKKFLIVSAFFVFFILLSLPFFYYDSMYRVKVETDKHYGGLIKLEYIDENKPILIEVKIASNTKAEFKILSKTLSSFRLFVPENVKVKKVVIKGDKRKILPITSNLLFQTENIKPGKYFDVSNFILIVYLLLSILGLFLLFRDIVRKNSDFSEKNKLLNIEFLRVLFTIGVVCCHFFPSLGLYTAGGTGVYFFFILSGYFLVFTYNSQRLVLDFIKKKFIRFVPLVVFGGLLCSIDISVLETLFFLQNTGLILHDISNVPSWYIGVLFWVSLFYFSLMRCCSKEQSNFFIAVISFCAYVLCVGAKDKAQLAVSILGIPFGFIEGLACIGAGCLLGRICYREQDKGICYKKIYSCIELFVCIIVVMSVFVTPVLMPDWILWFVLYVALIGLFIFKKGILSNFFELPVFAFLSRYCLAVFLTHYAITGKLSRFIEQHYSVAITYRWELVAVGILCSFGFGVFAHHLIEKPVGQLLKKRWISNTGR